MTTAADADDARSEESCFLTVHATVLCVVDGGFVHVPVTERFDRAALVVAAAPPARLRTLGRPAQVELRGAPAVTVSASGQTATVNLAIDGAFLSAGDAGGAIVRVGAPHGWEEFLPVAPAALDRLRELVAHDAVSLPDRRFVPAAASGILPDFQVLIGGRTVSLRDADLLDGGAPGRVALRSEGRLAILQRVAPVLVFRHDGTAEADAEIELGLASLQRVGGFPGLVVAETLGGPASVDGVRRVARPASAPGLLHFGSVTGQEGGPILVVANGVLFDGPAAPIVATAAIPGRHAAAPWLRDAWETLPARDGDAVDPAIVAGPAGGDWGMLADLVAAAAGLVPDDASALRLALAAGAAAAPNPLRGFVAAGGPDAASLPSAGRGLLNLRSVPREVRAEVMRACLDR